MASSNRTREYGSTAKPLRCPCAKYGTTKTFPLPSMAYSANFGSSLNWTTVLPYLALHKILDLSLVPTAVVVTRCINLYVMWRYALCGKKYGIWNSSKTQVQPSCTVNRKKILTQHAANDAKKVKTTTNICSGTFKAFMQGGLNNPSPIPPHPPLSCLSLHTSCYWELCRYHPPLTIAITNICTTYSCANGTQPLF